MARKPAVNYWSSRGAYGCWHAGRQRILAQGPEDAPQGPTYLAALDAFRAVLAMDNAAQAKEENTVRVVLESYLQSQAPLLKPGTVKLRQYHYALFCALHGELKVKDLTHFVVYGYCAGQQAPRPGGARPWGAGTARLCMGVLAAAFSWAADSGLLAKNPLARMRKPRARSCGRERLLEPEDLGRLLALLDRAKHRPLHDLVTVLAGTGARPGEVCAAGARDYDEAMRALVYHAECRRLPGEFAHKTAGKEKDRVIFLSGPALAVIRRLVALHPHGPLFRKANGSPWTPVELTVRFHRIGKVLELPGLCPYALRHTFATRWLEAKGTVEDLAELMGNTPAIIYKHYAHLCANPRRLREALEEFGPGARAAGTQSPPLRLRAVGE